MRYKLHKETSFAFLIYPTQSSIYIFNTNSHSPISSFCTMYSLERDSKEIHKKRPDFYQNVVVMRQGDNPHYVTMASCPWDPPHIFNGRVRAFTIGRKFHHDLGHLIDHVFVSPFLRRHPIEVISALCIFHDDPTIITRDGLPINSFKVKVTSSLEN